MKKSPEYYDHQLSTSTLLAFPPVVEDDIRGNGPWPLSEVSTRKVTFGVSLNFRGPLPDMLSAWEHFSELPLMASFFMKGHSKEVSDALEILLATKVGKSSAILLHVLLPNLRSRGDVPLLKKLRVARHTRVWPLSTQLKVDSVADIDPFQQEFNNIYFQVVIAEGGGADENRVVKVQPTLNDAINSVASCFTEQRLIVQACPQHGHLPGVAVAKYQKVNTKSWGWKYPLSDSDFLQAICQLQNSSREE